ncbi:MAG: AAA family ATPase [Candidatus Vogelbacteria bacterium]|nr:AAA family ATPase [Candidatus Vogelbacteria bacterium]
MKIKKIQNIKCGAFKNFIWDATVGDFHDKVNIILGWNGSGKTIVSRIIRSYEKGIINSEDKINGAQFTTQFDTGAKKHSELSGFTDKIRVFNEDYIKEAIDQTHLPYVVAIGSAGVDFSKKEKELEGAKEKLSKLKACKNEYDDISKEVSENIRKISGIGHLRKDPVVESNGLYNSYIKSSFEKRIEWLSKAIIEGKQVDDFISEESELKQRISTLSNLSVKEREYKTLKKWNDWVVEKTDKINKYLTFIPVYKESKRLAKYSDGSLEEKWVREGIGIHKLNETEKLNHCLFCESEITNEDELLKHFSEDVMELSNALDGISAKTESAISEIGICESFYVTKKETLETLFLTLRSRVEKKRKDIKKIVEKITFDDLFVEEETFDVGSIAWSIEKDYVARAYIKYTSKKKEYEDCQAEKSKHEGDIKLIEEDLKELKKVAKNVQIPADRINRLLKSTFPYKEISLDDSDGEVGYVLKRDGAKCELSSLSEGERNFLALAYFLLSINDEDNQIDKNSVIVIDDPVSSLDSDSLFQVFAILSGEIESRPDRQYFILSHNLDIFGHLLQSYRKDGKIRDDLVKFFQISLKNTGSTIQELDDNLKKYRSDYLYSITKLNEVKDSIDLDDAILAANLLRRALETFLHFKYGHGDLKSKLAQLYAKYKKYRLDNSNPADKDVIEQEVAQEEKVMYRFINHGSHEFLGFDKYDVTVLQASSQRIKNFFEVIKSVDKDHYATYNI